IIVGSNCIAIEVGVFSHVIIWPDIVVGPVCVVGTVVKGCDPLIVVRPVIVPVIVPVKVVVPIERWISAAAHFNGAVVITRRGIAIEPSIIPMVPDTRAAGDINVPVVNNGAVSPPHAPVVPSPSPIVPVSDGDAHAKAQTQPRGEEEPSGTWTHIVSAPGRNRRAINGPGIIPGKINNIGIRRRNDNIAGIVFNRQLLSRP